MGNEASKFNASSTASQVAHQSGIDMQDKVAIVTGANTGIGKETARVLASLKIHVIMGVRKEEESKKIAEEIMRDNIGSKVTVIPLDLSNFTSIRKFCVTFLQMDLPLHLLICNAGVMGLPHFTTTVHGIEMQFGVNHVGHFLLFKLLANRLLSSSPSRVICVSSYAHEMPGTMFNIANLPPKLSMGYDPWKAYGISKLCNILMSKEINRRYGDKGVTSFSLHPGAIPTELGRNNAQAQFFYDIAKHFIKTIPQGAATTIYCCITDKVTPGGYYADCQEKEPSLDARNASFAKLLWRLSNRLVQGYDTPVQLDLNNKNEDENKNSNEDNVADNTIHNDIEEEIELEKKNGTVLIAPELWVSDEKSKECALCGVEFTAITRIHHCRFCGESVCKRCSQNKMAPVATQTGVTHEPVRACDECYVGRTWTLNFN